MKPMRKNATLLTFLIYLFRLKVIYTYCMYRIKFPIPPRKGARYGIDVPNRYIKKLKQKQR